MARRGTGDVVRIEGAERLRRISRSLRQMGEEGREVRRSLARELRRIGTSLVREERAAVRALPSRGQSAALGRASLRQAIARATRAELKTSGRNPRLTVRVNPRRMPEGQAALPAYMEGETEPWRHPVFGNTDVWVSQDAKPWFWRTAERHLPRIEAALLRVLREVEDEIEGRIDDA